MSKKFEIRSAFSSRDPVHVPLSGLPSRTKQEFRDEVNINEIIARMHRGISPPAWMTSATPRYGDFTNLPVSFQEAHSIMEAGNAAFMGLPLEMRRAADHDPRNIDQIPREMFEKFGLLKPKEPVEARSGTPDETSADSSASPSGRASLSSNEPTGSKKPVKKPADNADQ